MPSILAPVYEQFLTFFFVLTRISGLVMTVPILGARTIPVRVRALLAFGLAVVLAPLYWQTPIEDPGNLLNLAVLLSRELIVGLGLGLGIVILFVGLQLTGEIIGQMSGMQLADVVHPTTDNTVPIFSQLLDWITLVVFAAIGGHRELIAALLETFQWMPPGHVRFPADLVMALSELTTQSFMLGIRAAAPMLIALLLSVLILGLVSRTLPQLNILAVGFSFNSMVMLATLSISLGAVAWMFQDQLATTLDLIRAAILPSVE